MKIGERMTSQWRHKSWPTWKCRFSAKYKPKLTFSLIEFEISKFYPFLLIMKNTKQNKTKTETVFLTCSVSFRSISLRYLSKWWLKIFSGGNHPPVPSDFDGLPYPRVRGNPQICFIKWPQRMYKRLFRCPGSLCFAFWCNRRQTVGDGNNPLEDKG